MVLVYPYNIFYSKVDLLSNLADSMLMIQQRQSVKIDSVCGVAAQVNAMGAEERAIPILEHVLKNHRVTNGDVQKMLGVSKPTATRLLQKLDAVLELVGHGVGSYYRIRNY